MTDMNNSPLTEAKLSPIEADTLTKALPEAKHTKCLEGMGME